MSALDEVLASLGVDDHAPRPSIAGSQDGLLASPLAVMECAVAAVSACMTAAADLATARSGRRPKLTLDAGHVAATMRNEVWLRDQDGKGIKGFAPLSRVWLCADGWVRTHANYPRHRSALLAAFGVPDGPDSVVEQALAAVFASLPGTDIEERAYGSGALAVAARTADQWQTSGPGAAVEASPLVAIDHAGSNAAALADPGALPASGVRVLDLTRVIAGPVGTRMLGALGAEVLRIDDPARPELPLHAVDGVIGKASTTLDLSSEPGRAIMERLLADADVLVSGYRPGSLRHLGLEADQVLKCHPHLIVVTLSAWGPGPWANRRGFDSLVQIASGIGWAASPDQERPGALPCQLLDHATGFLLAAGALAALARRARTGQSAHVRLSLARTAKWLLDQHSSEPRGFSEATQSEAAVARYRVPLGDGWSAIAPPGRLDGRSLSWPHLPPRYGSDPPSWSHPRPRGPMAGDWVDRFPPSTGREAHEPVDDSVRRTL